MDTEIYQEEEKCETEKLDKWLFWLAVPKGYFDSLCLYLFGCKWFKDKLKKKVLVALSQQQTTFSLGFFYL